MSDRTTGERTLEIGGKAYTFVLDLNAMAELEEMFSTPEREVTFDEVMQLAKSSRRIKYARAMIWALLQHHHPEVTLEQAGRLFTLATMLDLNEVFKDMAQAATPDKADARELGIDRPRKARVNGSGALTTGETSRSPRAARA